MERKVRRTDRLIPEKEARQILNTGEYGVLSTVSEDGQPYGVPLSYCFIDEAIYFHCALEGHKLENLNFNSRVSFCVVGNTEVLPEKFGTKYESVIMSGKAIEALGDDKNKGLLGLLRKYSSDFMEEGLKYIENAGSKTMVYKILLESITGKARK